VTGIMRLITEVHSMYSYSTTVSYHHHYHHHHHHPRISSRRKSWNKTSGLLCKKKHNACAIPRI